MSRGARLSIVGLYNADDGLFSKMVFPSQFTQDEKQTVVYNILSECAELECLFTDPDFMKEQIAFWSKLNIPEWQRIYTASLLEYNPIENYNRTELETISDDHSETHSGTDSSTSSSNNTSTNSGTDINTVSQTAYDSNNLLVHDRGDYQHGHVVTDMGSGSGSVTHGEKIVHDTDITKNSHVSGNIGVTTSQQMLEQEIDISAKLNVMKMIVESFRNRFCLLVY